jgi:hypothetical protein
MPAPLCHDSAALTLPIIHRAAVLARDVVGVLTGTVSFSDGPTLLGTRNCNGSFATFDQSIT